MFTYYTKPGASSLGVLDSSAVLIKDRFTCCFAAANSLFPVFMKFQSLWPRLRPFPVVSFFPAKTFDTTVLSQRLMFHVVLHWPHFTWDNLSISLALEAHSLVRGDDKLSCKWSKIRFHEFSSGYWNEIPEIILSETLQTKLDLLL